VPDNPCAWLMTTAKRRAIDQVRRAKLAPRAPTLTSSPDRGTAYRAIYVVSKGGAVEFVSVEEVNKHDY
jgi:predicted RNA polymerase sigma factor